LLLGYDKNTYPYGDIVNYIILIADYIEKIPATFWGVIVGSFFSILGVWVGNLSSEKRLKAQFDHEWRLRSNDRSMALRKEVYLHAAEAISAGLFSITRFSNFDLPNEKVIADYSEKAPAIAKVHVVGGAKTIEKLVAVTGELGAVFLRLFARRYEIMRIKSAYDSIQIRINLSVQEQSRIVELMKQYNLEGLNDKQRWSMLEKNMNLENEALDNLFKEQASTSPILQREHLLFMKQCAEANLQVSALVLPLLEAVREELEITTLDSETYGRLLEKVSTRQLAALDEFAVNMLKG